MYSVNGIPLDNPTMRWVFRAPSQPLSEFTLKRPNVTSAGRDGVVDALPPTVDPVSVSFVVQTPRANLEHLVALFDRSGSLTLTAAPTRTVFYELLSTKNKGYGAAEAIVDVTFVLRFPRPFWRDINVRTSTAFSLSTGSVEGTMFAGISAPIDDILVKARGPHAGVAVLDASGSWVNLPACSASETVVFDAATGEAAKNTSNSWAFTTDVSGAVDFGGPRGNFELYPQRRDPDPTIRQVEFSASTTGMTSQTTITFRGRSAYLFA